MLNQRAIDKIGRHLQNEGWTDEEISEALSALDTSKKVVNVALPLHFKEEALHHAKCHCKYVLNLKEGSKKYDNAFNEAYNTYLIEAYENSRGVEGPNSGSHKKANPAGIEVYVFDEISSGFIPEKEKEDVSEKAAAGLLFMGRDKWLQKSFKIIEGKIKDKNDLKEIATQYSAAVVSLANTFLYAFGGYKTKRKFGGRSIYKEGDRAEMTLEFSKKTGSENDKEKMLKVAYRQIARQIYIVAMSAIIAGATALDEKTVVGIEAGIESKMKELWAQYVREKNLTGPKAEMNLAFALKRKVREAIVESFFQILEKNIIERRNGQPGPRQEFLGELQQVIIRWASGGK